MDELLRTPQIPVELPALPRRGTARARVIPRLKELLALLLRPVPFLVFSLALGLVLILTSLYSPVCSVSVDGETWGTVADPAAFERMVHRAEARAGTVLGREYSLDLQPEYRRTLVARRAVPSAEQLEARIYGRISEIAPGYTLTVGGETVGTAADEDGLLTLLSGIKASYTTEDTVRCEFIPDVRITRQYVPAESILTDLSTLEAALTRSISGETTYTIEKGDTFSALARTYDLPVSRLLALNPDADPDRLAIGQTVTVKETVPYLSVRTTQSITYTQEIAPPVQEVEDSSMYRGEERVLDPGTPGTAMVTANVVCENGYERGREIVSSVTLTEPTVRVVAVGTRARPSWYPTGRLRWPLSGLVTSTFGGRYIFGSYSFHNGLDIAADRGTAIRASDGGTVSFADYKGSYGYLVIIDHANGLQTYYAHCSELLVSAGDHVYQGQLIGRVGTSGRATGSHCHFSVLQNGAFKNPYNYL